MKKTLTLEFPNGKTVELDEETTSNVRRLSAQQGVSVQSYIRALLKDAVHETFKVN